MQLWTVIAILLQKVLFESTNMKSLKLNTFSCFQGYSHTGTRKQLFCLDYREECTPFESLSLYNINDESPVFKWAGINKTWPTAIACKRAFLLLNKVRAATARPPAQRTRALQFGWRNVHALTWKRPPLSANSKRIMPKSYLHLLSFYLNGASRQI